jgi:pimeloyl-ACP methyl ester carboxylesterase
MDNSILNYRVVGNGPPLLLVHGFGISFNIWQNLLPLLCPYFTLVMVELPGVGGSPMPSTRGDYLHSAVEALEAVRRAMGFEIWNVLGYSTGSRIAEAYVKTYPEYIYRTVFLCPLKVENYKILLLRFCFWVDRFIPAIIPWLLHGRPLKFLILLFGFSLQSNSLIGKWQSEISTCPVQILKETARMIIPMGTRSFSVPVPFSLIWGDMDIVPIKPGKPGRHDYFVHTNHAAPMLVADKISEIIITFLKYHEETYPDARLLVR